MKIKVLNITINSIKNNIRIEDDIMPEFTQLKQWTTEYLNLKIIEIDDTIDNLNIQRKEINLEILSRLVP